MSFLSMLAPVAEDLRRVDALIGERLDSDVALVREVARYLEVIRRKTAKLFEASARLGAVLARAPAPLEAALADYGMHVGTAFQLVDDVLDYSGDATTIGKSLGDDLAEGKPTLPLIHVLQAGDSKQAALIRKAIQAGGREEFGAVLEAIRACGSLDYTRAAARRQAAAAARGLRRPPPPEF